MAGENNAKALEAALTSLCAEREDGGRGLTLLEVCQRAGLSRSTANRGEHRFSEVFKKWKAGLVATPTAAAMDAKSDTVSGLRKVNNLLANQIQALALDNRRQAALLDAMGERAGTARIVAFERPRGGSFRVVESDRDESS